MMAHKTAFNKTEDFWAIVIAGIILLGSSIIYFQAIPEGLDEEIKSYELILEKEDGPIKTIEWHKANDALDSQKLSATPIGKFLKKLTSKPNSWTNAPAVAFYKKAGELGSNESVSTAESMALEAQEAARNAGYANPDLNELAEQEILKWRTAKQSYEKSASKSKAGNFSFLHLALLFGLLLLCFGFGVAKIGERSGEFAKGFLFVFLIAFISLFLASQKGLKDLGIEYAVWAIVIGMLISNTIGTPRWVVPSLKTEFYIKTGLIIMGAEVLFNKILAIGLPGMFVAWVVTPIVLVSTFWFGQKVLKISSKSLNITISADMSVCGVSAAVAVAAASKATREELTVAIGLSMVFTAIMMTVMPIFVKFMGMPEILGGAWIGGTVDSSGAVVAAGAALGEKAMYVAATIKMIQNVLIGFVAFGVAIYFARMEGNNADNKIGAMEIWHRFPKFILGFIAASLVFTFLYTVIGERMAYSVIDHGILDGFSKNLRTWLFCIAFTSIGLSTNFRELSGYFKGGKPLLLYVCGQSLNILLTLGMAYLMFYKVFPHITGSL